jgi:class 3 adenylate cyclase
LDTDRSSRRAALALWLLGLPLSAATGLISWRNEHSPLYAIQLEATILTLLTTGLIAWWRRPDNATGKLLIAAGFAVVFPAMAVNSRIPWLAMVGFIPAGFNEVILAYVLLGYPLGKVSNRFDRRAVASFAVLLFVLGVALVLTTNPAATRACLVCPSRNPFDIAGHGATRIIGPIVLACTTVVGITVLVRVLVRVLGRWFAASRTARRTLTPVLFGGVVAAVAFVLRFASANWTAFQISFLANDLIPIGLLVGFMRLRLARAAVGDLALDLATRTAAREGLQEALASRLRDPSLVVAFWSAPANAFVDRDGVPVALPSGDASRAVTLLERDGSPQVAIVHDPALREDPKMVDQVAAVVRLAAEHIADELPAGTVTFLFTDIEGSTEHLGRLGEAYGPALVEHRRILRTAVAGRHGVVIDSRADEFFAAFREGPQAVAAAIDAQREFAVHPWPDGSPLKVRMGIHTGRPRILAGGYVGLDVHRAARACSAGHGGQVVVSADARAAMGVSGPGEATFRELGRYHLKGLAEPEDLYQLVVPGLSSEFPPLKASTGDG